MTDGFLRVSVSTAQDALPVEGALVTASQKDQLLYSLRSDPSGRVPLMRLDAPDATASQQPGSAPPYSEYAVRIAKDGYYPVIYQGTPIFGGITTDLSVELVPIFEGTQRPATQVYPPYSNTLEGGR